MRKRSRQEMERLRREARNQPNVRRLRELAERAQAELDARKRDEAPQTISLPAPQEFQTT